MSSPALVRAEILKLRSTRATVVLVVCAVVAAVLLALLIGLTLPVERAGRVHGGPNLADPLDQRQVFTFPYLIPSVLVLVLGALLVTNEWRHGSATPTFLATPRRTPVALAKLAAAAVVGVVVAVLTVAPAAALLVVLLGSRGAHIGYDGRLYLAMLGPAAGLALFVMIGAALGLVLRNQVAAIVVGIVLVVVSDIVVQILVGVLHAPESTRSYLPSGAAQALDGIGAIPSWAGALVLVGYVVVLGGVGAVLLRRRDV